MIARQVCTTSFVARQQLLKQNSLISTSGASQGHTDTKKSMHHAGNPHQKKEQISIAIKVSVRQPSPVSCGWTILLTSTTGHQWIEAKLISNVTDHWIKKHVKISILTLSTRLLFSLQNYSLLAKEDVSEQISECTYIVVPNWSYRQLILFQSHMFLLTKSQRLIAVVNVLTSNSNQ